MPETKKTEAAKAVAAKKSAPVAAPAKEEVKKTTAKKAAEKKETKATAKKTAEKKVVEKKVVEKKPVEKKAPANKAAANAEAEVKTSIVLQYADKNVTFDTLVDNAKNVCVYDMGKKEADIKKLDLYVKPEENTVYFVLNDDENGSYAL